jgi:hypothetical protein
MSLVAVRRHLSENPEGLRAEVRIIMEFPAPGRGMVCFDGSPRDSGEPGRPSLRR